MHVGFENASIWDFLTPDKHDSREVAIAAEGGNVTGRAASAPP